MYDSHYNIFYKERRSGLTKYKFNNKSIVEWRKNTHEGNINKAIRALIRSGIDVSHRTYKDWELGNTIPRMGTINDLEQVEGLSNLIIQ